MSIYDSKNPRIELRIKVDPWCKTNFFIYIFLHGQVIECSTQIRWAFAVFVPLLTEPQSSFGYNWFVNSTQELYGDVYVIDIYPMIDFLWKELNPWAWDTTVYNSMNGLVYSSNKWRLEFVTCQMCETFEFEKYQIILIIKPTHTPNLQTIEIRIVKKPHLNVRQSQSEIEFAMYTLMLWQNA